MSQLGTNHRGPGSVTAALMVALSVVTCRSTPASRSLPAQIIPPATTAAAPSSAASPSSPVTATPVASVTATPWPPPPPDAESDFCSEGVRALDERSCYVLPDAPTDELLIYLHGIVPPTKSSPQKSKFQSVVRAASRRANVAAVMPRGRVGLAPPGHAGWWGWPTSRASYQSLAAELLAEMAEQRRRLESLTGRPFQRVYLAGSSSGAYFVTALLVERALPVDGYGIISGAADPAADLTPLPHPPVYLGFGTHDPVGAAARSFAARLSRAGFPVQVATHPLPHGTAEIYLDEAFAHFRAKHDERGRVSSR